LTFVYDQPVASQTCSHELGERIATAARTDAPVTRRDVAGLLRINQRGWQPTPTQATT
jgi:hypothetical protein